MASLRKSVEKQESVAHIAQAVQEAERALDSGLAKIDEFLKKKQEDNKDDDEPVVVVTDRAHNTLQVLGLDGTYKRTISDFGLPANIDTFGDLMVVPELVARVSILDRDYNTLVTLGDDRERVLADKKENNGFVIRTKESAWEQGKFVHPHDACFDNTGNLFVADWVSTGRITKLTRV